MISIEDIREAAGRLKGVVDHTPVLTSSALDSRAGGAVFVKAESLQRGGSFKLRGAFNKLASLPPDVVARGVATYSSGNHAQAVAIAAGLLQTSAVIVMPSDAPREKVDATAAYGAEIIEYDRYAEDRVAIGARVAKERGVVLVPPYDDPAVMAGQGTAALELVEDAGALDVLVVPLGGGGLMAGSATVAKAYTSETYVVGVEPAMGDDTRRSLAAGERVVIPVPRTIADGLQAATPGELTFEVNRRLVDEVVTVSDEEIVEAMRFLFERMKLVVEPSGAVAVAALLSRRLRGGGGRRVGALISGGNVSAERFSTLLRG